MRSHVALVAIALLAAPLAGCLGGSGGTSSAPANASRDGAITAENASTNVSAPAAAAHVHDRWNGQDVRTVIDRTVTTGATTDVDPTGPIVDTLVCAFICGSLVEFAPREGDIVPPGTANVTFTASWDAAPPPGHEYRVFADYMPANASGYLDLAEVESGTTYGINTTVEMADGGHAKQSLWKFRLFVLQCSSQGGLETCTTRLSTSGMEIDVTVEAHRVEGRLPVEPPHPDWWADGTSRTAVSVQGQADTVGAAGLYATRSGQPVSFVYEWINGSEHRPVPPQTKLLVANVTWTNSAPTAGAAGVQPDLWYSHGPFDYAKWQPDEVGDGQARFVLPIKPNMTDGMYAEDRSRWSFILDFTGARDTGVDGPFFGQDIGNPYRFQGSYNVTMRAYNVTEPST